MSTRDIRLEGPLGESEQASPGPTIPTCHCMRLCPPPAAPGGRRGCLRVEASESQALREGSSITQGAGRQGSREGPSIVANPPGTVPQRASEFAITASSTMTCIKILGVVQTQSYKGWPRLNYSLVSVHESIAPSQIRSAWERRNCSSAQVDYWDRTGCWEGGSPCGEWGAKIFRFRCGDRGGASVNENRLAVWFRGCFPTCETLAGRVSSAKPVNLVRNASVAGGKTGPQPSNRTKTGGQPVRHEKCGSKIRAGWFLARRSLCTLPALSVVSHFREPFHAESSSVDPVERSPGWLHAD